MLSSFLSQGFYNGVANYFNRENKKLNDEAEILTSEIHDPYARTTGA